MVGRVKVKSLVMAVAFVAAIGLFGTPVAPGTSVVPTVGGVAEAYAPPCLNEFLNMKRAWDYYYSYGGYWAFLDFLDAAMEYQYCLQG